MADYWKYKIVNQMCDGNRVTHQGKIDREYMMGEESRSKLLGNLILDVISGGWPTARWRIIVPALAVAKDDIIKWEGIDESRLITLFEAIDDIMEKDIDKPKEGKVT